MNKIFSSFTLILSLCAFTLSGCVMNKQGPGSDISSWIFSTEKKPEETTPAISKPASLAEGFEKAKSEIINNIPTEQRNSRYVFENTVNDLALDGTARDQINTRAVEREIFEMNARNKTQERYGQDINISPFGLIINAHKQLTLRARR